MMKKLVKNLLNKLGLEVSLIKDDKAKPNPSEELLSEFINLPQQTLSIENKSLFFGYHDKSPYNHVETKVLATSVSADDTKPENECTLMEIGFFEKKNHDGIFNDEFVKINETTTWSWQQGCMLQWNPSNANREIIFNKITKDNYGAVIMDVDTKKIVREFNMPFYSLDPNGRYASSLNFGRLGRLRPGYGYSIYSDPTLKETAPEKDGVFLIDIESGAAELVVSVAQLADHTEREVEHYVNHISFSPSGNEIVFFHIYPDHSGKRIVRFYLYSIISKELTLLEAYNRVSHFCWRNEDEILTSEGISNGCLYYLYNLRNKTKTMINLPDIGDIHPMFNPVDKDVIVADTKPDKERIQHLFLFDIITGNYKKIGSFFSPQEYSGEVRCDLHPRWDRSGNKVIVDTTRHGKRTMVIIDTDGIFRE